MAGLTTDALLPRWPGGGIIPVLSPRPVLEAGLVLTGAAIFAARRFPRSWAILLSAAMFGAGAAHARLHRHEDGAAWRKPQPVRLLVQVERVNPPKTGPGAHRRSRATASGLARVVSADPTRDLRGRRLYFSLLLRQGQTPPLRSAIVEMHGMLRRVPDHPPANSFPGYLAGLGADFELSPAWLGAERQAPAGYPRFCEALATRMYALLGRGFTTRPDLAAIYRAMMLGRKGDLTAGQKLLFIQSGTMHLFAINGLHIGIVALSVHALLALLRCPRLLGAGIVLAILWLDVDSTGASPSAIRAFLMIATLEAGRALALPANPLSALAVASAAMLALQPADFFSASFQMSFSVVAVLITLGVPLGEHLAGRETDRPDWLHPVGRLAQRFSRHLRGAAGFGAAAAAVSAISGVEYFNIWAPSGLAANLLLMPLATLVIIAGFAAIASGLLHLGPVCLLFNAAARVLLSLITAAIRAIVAVPGASLPAHYFAPWIGPTALAAIVIACLIGYATDWRRGPGWWPPFAIAAATLALGVHFG